LLPNLGGIEPLQIFILSQLPLHVSFHKSNASIPGLGFLPHSIPLQFPDLSQKPSPPHKDHSLTGQREVEGKQKATLRKARASFLGSTARRTPAPPPERIWEVVVFAQGLQHFSPVSGPRNPQLRAEEGSAFQRGRGCWTIVFGRRGRGE
jgi:hypothetical protein